MILRKIKFSGENQENEYFPLYTKKRKDGNFLIEHIGTPMSKIRQNTIGNYLICVHKHSISLICEKLEKVFNK